MLVTSSALAVPSALTMLMSEMRRGASGRGGIGVDHPHHDVAGGGVLRQAGDAGSGLCEGEDVVARGGEVVAVKG